MRGTHSNLIEVSMSELASFTNLSSIVAGTILEISAVQDVKPHAHKQGMYKVSGKQWVPAADDNSPYDDVFIVAEGHAGEWVSCNMICRDLYHWVPKSWVPDHSIARWKKVTSDGNSGLSSITKTVVLDTKKTDKAPILARPWGLWVRTSSLMPGLGTGLESGA